MAREELLKVAKPILFNAEMAEAILAGRKMQARRAITKESLDKIYGNDADIYNGKIMQHEMCQGMLDGSGGMEVGHWYEDVTNYYSKYQIGETVQVVEQRKICMSDSSEEELFEKDTNIFLKITNVRVERLQDISFSDIIKEGVSFNEQRLAKLCGTDDEFNIMVCDEYYTRWENLWNKIAPKCCKWEDNPYVFVYEFEKVEAMKWL